MAEKRGRGRPKGSKSKRTQAVEELLASVNCNPILGMAEIAADVSHPIELRASMFKELAQYVAPKRKAIEVSGGAEPMTIEVVTGITGAPGCDAE